MARRTCKLFGIEFESPITLDEVPKRPGDRGDQRSYFIITHDANGFRTFACEDYGRSATRSHVAAGMAHWTEKAALKHIEALKAFNQHAIDHAA